MQSYTNIHHIERERVQVRVSESTVWLWIGELTVFFSSPDTMEKFGQDIVNAAQTARLDIELQKVQPLPVA